MSVITADRLRKFNDARGTVAGTVTEELAAANKETPADVAAAELENNQGGEDGDNGEGAPDFDREEEMDEVASQLM